METTSLNVRVDRQVKKTAESICESLGMNLSTAINIFLRQLINHDGLPFEVVNPRYNEETIAAFREAEDIIAGRVKTKSYASAEEFFADMDTEDYESDAEI